MHPGDVLRQRAVSSCIITGICYSSGVKLEARARRVPFESQPAGSRPCPNCNAKARLVLEREKQRAPFWQLYIICDKCKGEQWIGFVSHFEKNRNDRHRELIVTWSKAKTPAERGRIMRQVQRLAREGEEWTASL